MLITSKVVQLTVWSLIIWLCIETFFSLTNSVLHYFLMRNFERPIHPRRINQRVLSLYFTMCCILIVVVEFTRVSKGHSILTTHDTTIKRTLHCSLVSMIHKQLLDQQQPNDSPRCSSLYWRYPPAHFLFQDHSARSNPAYLAPPQTPTSTSTAPSTRFPSSRSTSLRPTMRRNAPRPHPLRKPSSLLKSKTAHTMWQTRSHR